MHRAGLNSYFSGMFRFVQLQENTVTVIGYFVLLKKLLDVNIIVVTNILIMLKDKEINYIYLNNY